MRTIAIAVLALLALAAPAASADDSGDALSTIDAAMIPAVHDGFGGAILIESKGAPIFAKAYGYADRARKIPFSMDTVAQIGSITKPMTALAILELAGEGKLDLEKPVKTYLPDAADPAGSATLHQILTHHAGLTDTCGDDFDSVSKETLLHRCLALPLAHPAGEDNYSNMGFSILAAVVEKISGESWEHYLRAHIWRPLGMHRTGFARFDAVPARGFAIGYLDDKPQGVISDNIAKLRGNDWDIKGNGGVQSSTLDMERFWRGLTSRLPGIPLGAVHGMTTPQDPISGEAWEGFGLAVRLDANGKPYRIGHSGSDGTFFAYFGWLPQQDIFVYVVGNNGEKNVKPIVQTALRAALKIAGIALPAPTAPPK